MRQSKTSNGVTTNHYYDGQNVALDETNGNFTAYNRGLGLLSRTNQNGTQYYHFNIHGDTSALTDSNGEIVLDYRYDAFGNQLKSNENDTNPFRYCGEYFDEETGFVYLRNRYYDPSIGRFITEDPANDGNNWYVYCGNNPVMFVDPEGLEDVMLKYIVEKNNGSISWNDKTKTATVNMPGFKPMEVSGRNINGRIIVDSKFLMDNFALSKDEATHSVGDVFERESDAVMAFALKYHQVSLDEKQEYGANITYSVVDGSSQYKLGTVTNSYQTAKNGIKGVGARPGVTLGNMSSYERNRVYVSVTSDTSAIVHTHWRSDGSLKLSNPNDYDAAKGNGAYLVNREGDVSVSYPKYNGPMGEKFKYGEPVRLFNIK